MPSCGAACVGGAYQIDEYPSPVEAAGLEIETVRDNSAYAQLLGMAAGRAG